MRGFLEKVLRTNGRTNGRTDGRTDGGELIGPISASGRGPKTLKTANFGQKLSNFGLKCQKFRHYKNFLGIQSMIFSKRTLRTTSIPKFRKIHSDVWKFQVKNSQNCQFWQRNDQILALNGQNFAISEFSWHKAYDFRKTDHKNSFHTKTQEDPQGRLEVIGKKFSKLSILAKNGKILVLNSQNFNNSEFSRHIKYDILKEDHKNNFHTQNQEDL